MTPITTEAPAAVSVDSRSAYWGYHLILDCRAGDRRAVTDRETILGWVRQLVERIDMRAYGRPVCEHFATHDPQAAGYSLVQLIETSSITAHFVDSSGDAYIDIFSCKRFEVDTARALVEEYFRPTAIRVTYLTRQA
ncbi:MAG: S-adenosylmethionine decarboxylase family protein [Burkholderiales bacterium]|jgi:S-adenosylmethionine/arginine decarboxylase-like enzyme